MIRSDRLVISRSHGSQANRELEADLAREIAGEVRFDAGSQAIYAHDGSNYRQVPIGVVIPRSAEDVEQALRTCRSHGVPVVSRGGGTSLAGQTVNRAVVIDHSKYMNEVIEIDAGRRRVRVQPGCVLDDMRAALGKHGPTTSTSCCPSAASTSRVRWSAASRTASPRAELRRGVPRRAAEPVPR